MRTQEVWFFLMRKEKIPRETPCSKIEGGAQGEKLVEDAAVLPISKGPAGRSVELK